MQVLKGLITTRTLETNINVSNSKTIKGRKRRATESVESESGSTIGCCDLVVKCQIVKPGPYDAPEFFDIQQTVEVIA